jgi:hypothetical protein
MALGTEAVRAQAILGSGGEMRPLHVFQGFTGLDFALSLAEVRNVFHLETISQSIFGTGWHSAREVTSVWEPFREEDHAI